MGTETKAKDVEAVAGGRELATPAVLERRAAGAGASGVARRPRYLRVRTRFLLSVAAGLAWAGFSTWIALPWIDDLATAITAVPAWLLVVGIAIIPGYLNVQLATSVLLDRPKPLRLDLELPGITVLIAAYNEEACIGETLDYALAQDYEGDLRVVVIDDGSTDRTREIVRERARSDPRLRLLEADHGGKARALTLGLQVVETPLVATIDADTLLLPFALRRAVARLALSPPDTVAVAGSVMARNSRENLLTRLQQWDYLIGIASVKRSQALLQGTLVAQGAFSVFATEAVRAVGGWPDTIGEDIVLTWALMRRGGRISFEPTAVAFTEVPSRLGAFIRQRRRWARGMIEGLRDHGKALLLSRRPYAHAIAVDVFFPYLDAAYAIGIPAGIVLACTGNFAIVGPLTLLVLPFNGVLAGLMLVRQSRVFRAVGLAVRRSRLDLAGLVVFTLLYQLIMSPVALSGYIAELVRARRVW